MEDYRDYTLGIGAKYLLNKRSYIALDLYNDNYENEYDYIKDSGKKQKGDNYMSQLIDDLVGEQCTIKSEAILNFAGKTELSCTILDADDEWMKICYTDKKNKQVTKLLRIEAIDEIEIEE